MNNPNPPHRSEKEERPFDLYEWAEAFDNQGVAIRGFEKAVEVADEWFQNTPCDNRVGFKAAVHLLNYLKNLAGK